MHEVSNETSAKYIRLREIRQRLSAGCTQQRVGAASARRLLMLTLAFSGRQTSQRRQSLLRLAAKAITYCADCLTVRPPPSMCPGDDLYPREEWQPVIIEYRVFIEQDVNLICDSNLNRDFGTFGDWTIKIRFKRPRFDFRFDLIFLRFDLKKLNRDKSAALKAERTNRRNTSASGAI